MINMLGWTGALKAVLCAAACAVAVLAPAAQAKPLTAPVGPQLFANCSNVAPDWFPPECWVAAHARISFGGDRVFYYTPHTSRRWGNALSSYWQARALALIAGHGFDSYEGFDRFWLKHLPKRVPASTCPDLRKLEAACASCDHESWTYSHRCAGGAWQAIRPTIVADTHAAVQAWAKETGFVLPTFAPGDVVIQSRCAPDTLLSHEEYGPVAFSMYERHIRPDAKRVIVVADRLIKHAPCHAIHDAQLAHLRAKFPAAAVELVGGSVEEDFMRLLLAPVLFKDSQSSFGHWAALANKGETWSVPLLAAFNPNSTMPDLGPSWHWASDVPVLYPGTAKAAGVSLEDPGSIVKWLQTH